MEIFKERHLDRLEAEDTAVSDAMKARINLLGKQLKASNGKSIPQRSLNHSSPHDEKMQNIKQQWKHAKTTITLCKKKMIFNDTDHSNSNPNTSVPKLNRLMHKNLN
ncbi:hypothetical protein L6452_15612 [Arctium lappa]|uniref:Uncharacterized protein n=1 Tax=Arctium lappa TaxID=4217 RepID=A0ACB9CP94_ARCLA|nr:hypothetical protein L6452_15612 [Arctium lappa]